MRSTGMATFASLLLATASIAAGNDPGPSAADLDYLKTVAEDLADKDLAALAGLKDLTLDREVYDAGLEHLSRLTGLEDLTIKKAKNIRGPGLAHLAGLPNLKSLRLSSSGIGDRAVASLPALPGLKVLTLSYCDVTDAGLVGLKGLTSLETLVLGNTKIRVRGWST